MFFGFKRAMHCIHKRSVCMLVGKARQINQLADWEYGLLLRILSCSTEF